MKIAKKIAAGSLACATLATSALALTACGGSTWALKTDNAEISSGVYNYCLFAGYQNALYAVDDYTQPVLDQEVDGKPADEWIRNYALEYFIKPFLVVDEKFNELGLTLDDITRYNAEQGAIKDWNSTNTYGVKTKEIFEPYGVTRDDYQYVSYDYNAKFTAVFKAIYGKGGEKEVPQADMDAYFAEHYAAVDYIVAETVNADGSTMTDKEIDALVKQFQDFAKQINAGDMTMNQAANKHKGIEAAEGEEEPTGNNGLYTYIGSLTNSSATSQFPADFIANIKKAKADKTYALDLSDEGYVILYTKRDDEAAKTAFFNEETEVYEQNIFQILVDMKQEEYISYMDELVGNFDASTIVYNEEVTTNLDLKALFEPTEPEKESSETVEDTKTEAVSETASADEKAAE